MTHLTSEDVINLDDVDDEVTEPLSEETVKLVKSLLESSSKIEAVTNCESCDGLLRVPVIVVSSGRNEERDSSILCDAKCTE